MKKTWIFQSQRETYRAIANPLHTALVIFIECANAYFGKIHADAMRHAQTVNRLGLYGRTILIEWLILAIVLVGVVIHGSAVAAVLGERWRSRQKFLQDLAIAIVLLMLSIAVPSLLGPHTSHGSANPAVQYLLPQSTPERLLWLFVAISAGICEEAVYRGYLQHQFIAFTGSAPVGIALSAIAFGASHAYQGVRFVILISLSGAIMGIAAFFRKSVRPGMIAHISQDLFALFIRH
ncbi:MAG: CPBP family intramembrane metalloprotease [Acidobacteriales bacterium]|nr:CPBP family intramembrane metalloprotease [Terriglobales bacterium]